MSEHEPKVDRSNPWVKKSSKEIYDNPWIHVKEHQVLNPAKKEGIYGTVQYKAIAVAIVPLTQKGETYLVGQYRYPVDEYSWEVPMGGCPLGTETLDTAKRELKEETGLVAKKWTLGMDRLWISNCVTDEKGVFYVAQDLEMKESEPEDTEELYIWKCPFDLAHEMALDGRIRDVLSVLSLIRTKQFLDEGKIQIG